MKKLNLLLCVLALFYSCSGKNDGGRSVVRFKLPDTGKFSSKGANPRDGKALSDLTSITEIDCFAILVDYSPSSGSCVDSAGVKVLGATLVEGSHPANTGIVMSVEAGSSRKFQVVGFATDLSACPNFVKMQASSLQKSSSPILVGSKTVDLVPGEEKTIEITATLEGAKKISLCEGGVFSWQTGGKFDTALFDVDIFGP